MYLVGVAQLVRAPDCGSGCRGFESHLPPQTEVRGSGLPRSPAFFPIGASPSGKARDFDSLIRWFESSRPSHFPFQNRIFDSVAQSVEQLPFKPWVRGSSPRWVTKKKDSRKAVLLFGFRRRSGGSTPLIEMLGAFSGQF